MDDYLPILKGRMPAQSDFSPVFAFSIHKAGSTLMHQMINDVCQLAGIPAVTIPDILFLEGYMDTWQADERLAELIQPGRVYYGFRFLPSFLASENVRLCEKKSVLLVRDPRDALVSEYFSFGGKYVSHQQPEKNVENFIKNIMKTADLDIDAYVLQSADVHFSKLLEYKNGLDFNNVLLRRYEEIFFDKESFLRDIFTHFELAVDGQIIKKVAKNHDVRPQKEDPSKHIRKATPGDHREKLKPETIDKLNTVFSDICKEYGYDLSV